MYVLLRQNTDAQYIATYLILDLYLVEDQCPGAQVKMIRWEKANLKVRAEGDGNGDGDGDRDVDGGGGGELGNWDGNWDIKNKKHLNIFKGPSQYFQLMFCLYLQR